MIRILVTFFTSLCLLSAFSQTGDREKVRIEGEILDARQNPVSYAHILSKPGNDGWVGDYYGKFRVEVFPGDTLIFSAISFHHVLLLVPEDAKTRPYNFSITMHDDTVRLKELVIHPWPATYEQLRRDFMKVEIDDPAADLDLHMPSMKEIAAMNRTPGVPGQIGLYSGSGPFSLIYDQFSKEARSKRLYAEVMKKEKAEKRYNRALVTRITGLKTEDDIEKFMEFCALQVKFILESTDYELYAAILNCYNDFCKAGLVSEPVSK